VAIFAIWLQDGRLRLSEEDFATQSEETVDLFIKCFLNSKIDVTISISFLFCDVSISKPPTVCKNSIPKYELKYRAKKAMDLN
jgi:hypothetical protein